MIAPDTAAFISIDAAGQRLLPSVCKSWLKSDATSQSLISTARLAQSAERKSLNLVVVGLSPTVGVPCVVFLACE